VPNGTGRDHGCGDLILSMRGLGTIQTEHHERRFGEGHAFRTPAGLVYRILRSVAVNGIELIVYETIRDAVRIQSTAAPIKEFAEMLIVEQAILTMHASQ
jgi:hypothetical protein